MSLTSSRPARLHSKSKKVTAKVLHLLCCCCSVAGMIVFLDIDGVLNRPSARGMVLERRLVRRLNPLSHMRFVLCSTWRHRFGLTATARALAVHGFRGTLCDAIKGETQETPIERYRLCRAYANGQPWVMLDDRGPKRPNVVRPGRHGLSKGNVEQILRDTT